ncbi:MAG: hypothetical protein IJV76_13445, partial [Clostridia bacterium]|nr:hypothetical protein [Clostridia bacterium]
MKTITSFYQLTEEEKQQLRKQYMDEHSKNTDGNLLVPEKPRMLLIQRHRRLRNTLILTSTVVLLVGGLSIYAAGTALPYKQVEVQPYIDRQTGQKLGTYSGWVNYFGGNPAGEGTVTLPDGSVFQASWNSLFGRTSYTDASCTFQTGGSYYGEFGTNLYPEGEGTFTAADGTSAPGFWTWTSEQAFKTEDDNPDNDCLYTGMLLDGQR